MTSLLHVDINYVFNWIRGTAASPEMSAQTNLLRSLTLLSHFTHFPILHPTWNIFFAIWWDMPYECIGLRMKCVSVFYFQLTRRLPLHLGHRGKSCSWLTTSSPRLEAECTQRFFQWTWRVYFPDYRIVWSTRNCGKWTSTVSTGLAAITWAADVTCSDLQQATFTLKSARTVVNHVPAA